MTTTPALTVDWSAPGSFLLLFDVDGDIQCAGSAVWSRPGLRPHGDCDGHGRLADDADSALGTADPS